MTYDEIKAGIAARGMIAPILVARDGTVLDGNNRVQAARELGLTEVPVVVIDAVIVGRDPWTLKLAYEVVRPVVVEEA